MSIDRMGSCTLLVTNVFHELKIKNAILQSYFSAECGFYNLPDMMQQLTEAIESKPLEKSSRLFGM